MAMDRTCEDVISPEKLNSISSVVVKGCENNQSGGFDCNICLDFVQDPVVTLCGHLFCWPCIYKWIHLQSVSPQLPENQQPQCPVCKAEVSKKTLVPLYGRGRTMTSSETKSPKLGITIPRRPPSPSCGFQTVLTTASPGSHQVYGSTYPRQPPMHYHHHGSSYGATTPTLSFGANVSDPVIGMFGEMIYARIFGDSATFYSYPNSYTSAGSSSPRVRRHVMQADKSLGRVCFFLFCCAILCLVLF